MDGDREARVLALLDEALEVAPGERDSWLDSHCGGDPALKARVTGLLRASDAPWIRTGTARFLDQDEELPDRIGAYRITGLIGQGGMGAVYRGERAAGDFDHVAAIKLIRPGALSEELVGRFRRERQTLARLSHPNIARLFDGGETDRGQPYLVMEYVDGRPLGSWLAEEGPSRAARLALFLKICAAVGAAHRNLVIHRDLTPANVLVDRAGEPKLIDFGIARPVDEAAGDTMTQTATPGFAAPERRAGTPATTLADIYALGVLLDMLLGEGADTDLRAIIACASAADPEARYPTVDALADDVERYRDGRAVEARHGGAAYRVRRFVGRYRWGVTAAAAALLLLVGALVVTLLANRRAEIARTEAEQRFEQTRSIAKTLLFEAFDAVGKVPGGTNAQVLLAETGLHYLDALAADGSAPVDVKAEVGRGYTRLSRAVGGGGGNQLGKLADADMLLKKARAVLTPLHAAHPDDPDVAEAYAGLLVESAAQNLYNNNQPERARAEAREARAVLAPYASGSASAAALFASSWQGEGDSFGWEEDWARARVAHEQAERFVTALPPALREAEPVLKARSANLRLLGEAYHKSAMADAARATLARAVSVNETLLARAPADPDLQRKLSLSLWYSAVVHRTNGRDAEAEQAISRSVDIARRLRARDNGTAGSLQLYAATTEVQSQVLADRGRTADSLAAADESIDAQRRLVALAGSSPGAKRSLAALLQTRGASRYKAGDFARACLDWTESLGIYRGFEAAGALPETDRQNGLVRMRDYTGRACGPPRGGLVIRD